MASRSRKASSTSPAPNRPSRMLHARWPNGWKGCCRGSGSPRFCPTSMAGPASATASPTCAAATRQPTSRPCWRRSWPTAPISVSRAWPTRHAGSATTIWSTSRNGTSATTTTSPPGPPSSTPTTGIRWPRFGTTGRPRPRTANISAPVAGRDPVAPSTPNTASTPAWSSIPTCPDDTGRSIPR